MGQLFNILYEKNAPVANEHIVLVLIAFSTNEGYVEPGHKYRLVRTLVVRVHNVWIKMKTQTKFRPLGPRIMTLD